MVLKRRGAERVQGSARWLGGCRAGCVGGGGEGAGGWEEEEEEGEKRLVLTSSRCQM